jgi:UDP-glucose 4-epimerase
MKDRAVVKWTSPSLFGDAPGLDLEKGTGNVIDLSNEQVLVTGAAGFVGRAVVRALGDAGAKVTTIDQVDFPRSGVDGLVGDLTDPKVRDAAVTEGLTGIVHLAAVTSVLRSVEDPVGVYEANVGVTASLLELARARGVERFLLSSTNAVVGDVGTATIREDMPLRPLTPYGATKAACEMLMSAYAGSYGMATCALRLTNVYGPGMEHKDSLVARLMKAALSGATVEVYGDGTQVRDFVHVSDVVRGLLLAWERRWVGPLILGSGRSVNVLEMLDAARRITGRPLPATHVPPKAGEMPAVIVDIGRARGIGYEPTVTLDQGVASAWADFGGQPVPSSDTVGIAGR